MQLQSMQNLPLQLLTGKDVYCLKQNPIFVYLANASVVQLRKFNC